MKADKLSAQYMIDGEHTRKEYDRKLRLLKDLILLMGFHAEQMVADAIRALVQNRSQVAEEVMLAHDTIENLEIEIDTLCCLSPVMFLVHEIPVKLT